MNIPVTVAPSFWVLSVLIAWLASQTLMQFASWIVVVFVSVFVHEMGHALTARMWGQNVQVVLGPLGGTTIYGAKKVPLSRLKEFCVVFAGPFFGFLLACVAFLLFCYVKINPNLSYFFFYLTYANVIWSLFNLLPVHPFDGGRMMTLFFDGAFGANGKRFSYLASGLFAVGLTALFMVYGFLFAGALMLLCAFESFRAFRQKESVRSSDTRLEAVQNEWNSKQPERAIEHLEELVQKSEDEDVKADATRQLAEYLSATGKNEKAYRLLSSLQELDGDSLKLLQLVAYKLGLWRESLDAGIKAFSESQDAACAILNAFNAAHLDDVDQAINWLSTVKKSHAVDMQAVLASEDFDQIRTRPDFKTALLKREIVSGER